MHAAMPPRSRWLLWLLALAVLGLVVGFYPEIASWGPRATPR